MPKKEENQYNYDYFFQFTRKLGKISCVAFTLYAIKNQKSFYQNVDCLNLVEKWLKNPNSITKKELEFYSYNSWSSVFTVIRFIAFSAGCRNVYNIPSVGDYGAANAASWASSSEEEEKLINYLSYLLPKEPELNNFNHVLLKQNHQAYSFLENISKLEDWQVTDDDLFGIRLVFDVLEEVGIPLDPNEFIWDGDVTEKHKLLQSIRREFNKF